MFSRFVIYSFSNIEPFKDVFDSKAKEGKESYNIAGEQIFKLYEKLAKVNQIEFKFTKEQQVSFVKDFGYIQNKLVLESHKALVPNLRRYGLIMFRISMILTALRNIETLGKKSEIVCSDIDYQNASNIIGFLLKNLIDSPTISDNKLVNKLDKELYNTMKSTFTRNDILMKGLQLGIARRTIDSRIHDWQKNNLIIKLKHNTFQKIQKPKNKEEKEV